MPAAVTAQIYKPGEVLCWEGDRGDEVWIVLQGNAEVWINGRPAPLSIPTKEKEEDAEKEDKDDEENVMRPRKAMNEVFDDYRLPGCHWESLGNRRESLGNRWESLRIVREPLGIVTITIPDDSQRFPTTSERYPNDTQRYPNDTL